MCETSGFGTNATHDRKVCHMLNFLEILKQGNLLKFYIHNFDAMSMCWEWSGLNFDYSYFLFGIVVAPDNLFNIIIVFCHGFFNLNFLQIFQIVNFPAELLQLSLGVCGGGVGGGVSSDYIAVRHL